MRSVSLTAARADADARRRRAEQLRDLGAANAVFQESSVLSAADVADEQRSRPPLVIPMPVVPEDEREALAPAAAATGRASDPSLSALRDALFANKQLVGSSDGSRGASRLLQAMRRRGAAASSETEALRRDLDSLPEPPSESGGAYRHVPIDEFGMAMLRGMGASEDTLRSNEGVYEADAPRASLRGEFMGLGAERDPRRIAQEEDATNSRKASRNAFSMQQAAIDAEARAAADSRRARLAWARPGLVVWMASGPYMGQAAIIQRTQGVPGLDRMQVRLLSTCESRVVRKVDARPAEPHEIDDSALAEAVKAEATARATGTTSNSNSNSSSSSSSHAGERSLTSAVVDPAPAGDAPASTDTLNSTAGLPYAAHHPRNENRESSNGSAEQKTHDHGSDRPQELTLDEHPWVRSGIRVRVANERWRGGRYFRLKAVVVDVVTPTRCTLLFEDGTREENVDVAWLQTALPKVGGRVVVVAGRWRGQSGSLVERQADQGVAIVRLDDDLRDRSISFDHVAELVARDDDRTWE